MTINHGDAEFINASAPGGDQLVISESRAVYLSNRTFLVHYAERNSGPYGSGQPVVETNAFQLVRYDTNSQISNVGLRLELGVGQYPAGLCKLDDDRAVAILDINTTTIVQVITMSGDTIGASSEFDLLEAMKVVYPNLVNIDSAFCQVMARVDSTRVYALVDCHNQGQYHVLIDVDGSNNMSLIFVGINAEDDFAGQTVTTTQHHRMQPVDGTKWEVLDPVDAWYMAYIIETPTHGRAARVKRLTMSSGAVAQDYLTPGAYPAPDTTGWDLFQVLDGPYGKSVFRQQGTDQQFYSTRVGLTNSFGEGYDIGTSVDVPTTANYPASGSSFAYAQASFTADGVFFTRIVDKSDTYGFVSDLEVRLIDPIGPNYVDSFIVTHPNGDVTGWPQAQYYYQPYSCMSEDGTILVLVTEEYIQNFQIFNTPSWFSLVGLAVAAVNTPGSASRMRPISASAQLGTPGRNGTTFGQRVRPDSGITKYGRLGLLDANADCTAVAGKRIAYGVVGITATATVRANPNASLSTLSAGATCSAVGTASTVYYYSPAPSGANGFHNPFVRKVDSGKMVVGYEDYDATTSTGRSEKLSIVMARWNDGAAPTAIGSSVFITPNAPTTWYTIRPTTSGNLVVLYQADSSFVFATRATACTYSEVTITTGQFYSSANLSSQIETSNIIPDSDDTSKIINTRFMFTEGTTVGISSGVDSFTGISANMLNSSFLQAYHPVALTRDIGYVAQSQFSEPPYGVFLRTIYLRDFDAVPGPTSLAPSVPGYNQGFVDGLSGALEYIDDRRALFVHTASDGTRMGAHACIVYRNDDDTVSFGPWYSIPKTLNQSPVVRAVVLSTERVILLTAEYGLSGTYDDVDAVIDYLDIDGRELSLHKREAFPEGSEFALAALTDNMATIAFREKSTGRVAGKQLRWREIDLVAGASMSVRWPSTAAPNAAVDAGATVVVSGTIRTNTAALSAGATCRVWAQKNVSWPLSSNDILIGKSHNILWVTANRGQHIKQHTLANDKWYYTEDGFALSDETVVVAGETTWSGRQDRRAPGMVLNKYGSVENDLTYGTNNAPAAGGTAPGYYTSIWRTGTTVWMGAPDGLHKLSEAGVQSAAGAAAGSVFRGDLNGAGTRLFYTKYSNPDSFEATDNTGFFRFNESHGGIFQWNIQNNTNVGAWIPDTPYFGRAVGGEGPPRGDLVVRKSNNDILVVLHQGGVEHYNSSATLLRTYTWDYEPWFHVHHCALHIIGDYLYLVALASDVQNSVFMEGTVNTNNMERIWMANLSTGLEIASVPIHRNFRNSVIKSAWASSFAFSTTNLGDLVMSATATTAGTALRKATGIAPLSAGADTTATGSFRWAGQAALSASATVATIGSSKFFALAALSAGATVTAVGLAKRLNNATLMTATGTTLTAIGKRAVPGLAALDASATLTAARLGKIPGVAALDATATLSANPNVSIAFSADATLTAIATRKQFGLADLSAGADTTAIGLRKQFGLAALTATSDTTAVGYIRWFALAATSAGATTTAIGFLRQSALAVLSADATTATIGTRALPGLAVLDATATATAIGQRRVPAFAISDTGATVVVIANATRLNNPAALSADATTTVVALRKQFGVVPCDAQATSTAIGLRRQFGLADISGGATVTVVGYGRSNGLTTCSATADCAAIPTVRALGVVPCSADATCTAIAYRRQFADSALSADATTTAAAEHKQQSDAALSADATASAVGLRRVSGDAVLSVSSDLTATARQEWRGNLANLSAGATTTAVGLRIRLGIAALTGGNGAGATVAAVAYMRQFALAALSAGATTTAVGLLGWHADANLTTGATVSVSGLGIRYALAAVDANATTAPTGTQVRFGDAALSAGASVVADPHVAWFAQAVLAADATTGASSFVYWFATANLAAAADTTAVGRYKWFGDTAISAAADVTVIGTRVQKGLANITGATKGGGATVTVVGIGRRLALANTSASATLDAVGRYKWFGDTTLTQDTILTVIALRVVPASADLSATATCSAVGLAKNLAAAQLTPDASVAADAHAVTTATADIHAEARFIGITTGFAIGRINTSASADSIAASYLRQFALANTQAQASVVVVALARVPGVVSLSADSTLTATATRVQLGAASVDAAATCDAQSSLRQFATAALDVDSSCSADGTVEQGGDAALSGTADAVASGIGVASDAFALTATATATSAATRVVPADAALVANAACSVTATPRVLAVASLSTQSLLTADGYAIARGVPIATVSATLTVATSALVFGDWDLTATASTSGSASRVQSADAALSAQASLTLVPAAIVFADASLVPGGTVTVEVQATALGQVLIAGEVTFTATATRLQLAAMSCTASAVVDLVGYGSAPGVTEIAPSSTLQVSGLREVPGGTDLTASSTLELIEHLGQSGLVVMTSAGTIAVDSTAVTTGASVLSADASFTLVELVLALASGSLTGTADASSSTSATSSTDVSLSAAATLVTAYNPFRFGVAELVGSAELLSDSVRTTRSAADISADAVLGPIPTIRLKKVYAEVRVDISVSGLTQSVNASGREVSVEVTGPDVVPDAKGQAMQSSVLEQRIESVVDKSLDILI